MVIINSRLGKLMEKEEEEKHYQRNNDRTLSARQEFQEDNNVGGHDREAYTSTILGEDFE